MLWNSLIKALSCLYEIIWLLRNQDGMVIETRQIIKEILSKDSASHTPAHESTATVAPFRAWRDSQSIIAGGPAEPPALSNKSDY